MTAIAIISVAAIAAIAYAFHQTVRAKDDLQAFAPTLRTSELARAAAEDGRSSAQAQVEALRTEVSELRGMLAAEEAHAAAAEEALHARIEDVLAHGSDADARRVVGLLFRSSGLSRAGAAPIPASRPHPEPDTAPLRPASQAGPDRAGA